MSDDAQIKAMRDLLGTAPADTTTEPPETTAPETVAPETDEPTTEVETVAPETDAPETAAPETEALTTEPPEDEPEDSRLRMLEEQNTRLLEQLNRMAERAGITAGRGKQGKAADPSDKDKKPLDVKELLKDVTFMTDDEIDEMVDDPSVVNKALKRVAETIFTKTVELLSNQGGTSKEEILSEVDQMIKLQAIRDDFYRRNPDLTKHVKFVSYTLDDELAIAQAAGEELSLEELLKRTEKSVRIALNLPKKAKQTKRVDKRGKAKRKTPAMPGAGRGKRPGRKPKPKDDQQAAMIELLD